MLRATRFFASGPLKKEPELQARNDRAGFNSHSVSKVATLGRIKTKDLTSSLLIHITVN